MGRLPLVVALLILSCGASAAENAVRWRGYEFREVA
jgi:hypothetical protein